VPATLLGGRGRRLRLRLQRIGVPTTAPGARLAHRPKDRPPTAFQIERTADAELMEDRRRLARSRHPRGVLTASALCMMGLLILAVTRQLSRLSYSKERPSWSRQRRVRNGHQAFPRKAGNREPACTGPRHVMMHTVFC
jgi:hypothetical protein